MGSAVALAALDVILDEKLPERARDLGLQLKDRLAAIKSPHTNLRVTGRGFLLAVHLDESHSSGRVTAARLGQLMRKRGVAVMTAENRVRIAPPLVIKESDLWKAVGIFEQALHDLVDLDEI